MIFLAIFLDISFIIGYYNKEDRYHTRSLQIAEQLKSNKYGYVFTSTNVLDELFTYIQRRHNNPNYAYNLAREWFKDGAGIAEILEINWNVFSITVDLFITQQNQRKYLSFTDCSNIAICETNQIKNIATYDEGFEGYLVVVR